VTSAELSIRLLRAAQQLWPENEEFGSYENEKETLEVLCKGDKSVSKIGHNVKIFILEKLPEDAFPDVPSGDDEYEDDLMDEENGNDYEDVNEAIIDVKEIIECYSHPDVLSKAGLLLREYKFNTPEVNRAICKLLHRIAFQLDRPAMCYSVKPGRPTQKNCKTNF